MSKMIIVVLTVWLYREIFNILEYFNGTAQPANDVPQDVPSMCSSNIPNKSPKDPIWPS